MKMKIANQNFLQLAHTGSSLVGYVMSERKTFSITGSISRF